jgi:hypothetical protein
VKPQARKGLEWPVGTKICPNIRWLLSGEDTRRYLLYMGNNPSGGTPLTYSEVRARLTSRAAFESHQEGTGKAPSYVLNVRPRYRGHEPFTLTGPDPAELLREALARLAPR